MGITVYSVVLSVIFYNISLVAVLFLCRSGAIRAKYTSALLLLLTLLGAVRLVTPIDLDNAYVIRSYRILPAVKNVLTTPLVGSLSLGGILLLIWASGTLAFVLRDLHRQRSFRRADKQLLRTQNEQISRIAAEFDEKFSLTISPDIELPYVTGLFKPVIYVPDIELSEEEWRNIFRHETQHIHAFDEWKKLFFRAIRAIFWWNPLVHLSEDDINLLIELQCDARVAGKGNFDEQEGYLRTMMELMKRYVVANAPVGASRMIGRQEEMKIRFETLLAPETRRGKWMRKVMPIVMIAVFLASYMVIIQPAGFPSEEDLTAYHDEIWVKDVSPDIKEEGDKFILYQDGKYRLYIDGEYVSNLNKELLGDPQFNTIPIYGGD